MSPSIRRSLGVVVLVVLVALAVGAVLALRSGPPAPPPNTIVPDQFVARLATEALGRGPSQGMWREAEEYFHEHGCTPDSLAEYAVGVYAGDEFGELDYDAAERAVSLYRGALAREPDPVGLGAVTSQLESGRDWDDVVGDVLASDELRTRLAPRICAPDSPAYAPVDAFAPLDLPASEPGVTGDQAALQQTLDATPAGGAVALARHAVIRLSSTLRVPAGVTLTTVGEPPPESYARMGRLVRASQPADPTASALVELGAGAQISGVWLDGGRAWLGGNVRAAVTVRINGDGAAVEGAKLSDPLGGAGIFVTGPNYGVPCAQAEVRDNVVTSYSSAHSGQEWADGVSVACSDAVVEGNAVIDATDVGIILYRVPGGRQQSRVAHNVVVAAGRSGFAALAADPLFGGGQTFSFEGTQVRDNTLWTGERTHFDIGLAVGTHPWFGEGADKGAGADFTGNTTGQLRIRTTDGIAVSGMLDTTVEDNELRIASSDASLCPPAAVAASRTGGWASGHIQGPVINLALSGCLGAGH